MRGWGMGGGCGCEGMGRRLCEGMGNGRRLWV